MKKEISNFIDKYSLQNINDLSNLIKKYKQELNPIEIYAAAEILNPNKEKNAAYYTDNIICEEIYKELPIFEDKTSLKILEPSVGAGSFIPFIAEKYKDKDNVEIWINDIDKNQLLLAKLIFNTFYKTKYKNIKIKSTNNDYLLQDFNSIKFDLIIGNPPYQKLKPNTNECKSYKNRSQITKTTNLFVYFLEKALRESYIVSLIIPKSILNAPEYIEIRNILNQYNILSIIDFGEKGFNGVKIETINLIIDTRKNSNLTKVISLTKSLEILQDQAYITDNKFPTWLIYRNQEFDDFSNNLQLGVFKVFRDRQISSKNCQTSGTYRILRSRNIETNKIIDIPKYDLYLDNIKKFNVYKFLNKENIVCVPNLSYKPRACFLPKNCIADGSVALLETNVKLTKNDLTIFETEEFRKYYHIARNYGTRSLNIDSNSVYYFGIRR